MTTNLPSALSITADAPAPVAVLTVTGVLDGTTYLRLRDAIIKAALDEPTAVIVNVSALSVPAPTAWSVFTSARWHVSTWPDVPLYLVCAHQDGRDAIVRNGITRYVPVHPSIDGAFEALAERQPGTSRRRARAQLPASLDSLRRSREVVSECFTAWCLPEFIPVAKVVVTAFVENVLLHTDGEPQVRLETDGATVTVAVEDNSQKLAGLREDPTGTNRPSGLGIVAALCRVWGSAPTASGKTVWAVIGPENRL
jgi:hypothetical protein